MAYLRTLCVTLIRLPPLFIDEFIYQNNIHKKNENIYITSNSILHLLIFGYIRLEIKIKHCINKIIPNDIKILCCKYYNELITKHEVQEWSSSKVMYLKTKIATTFKTKGLILTDYTLSVIYHPLDNISRLKSSVICYEVPTDYELRDYFDDNKIYSFQLLTICHMIQESQMNHEMLTLPLLIKLPSMHNIEITLIKDMINKLIEPYFNLQHFDKIRKTSKQKPVHCLSVNELINGLRLKSENDDDCDYYTPSNPNLQQIFGDNSLKDIEHDSFVFINNDLPYSIHIRWCNNGIYQLNLDKYQHIINSIWVQQCDDKRFEPKIEIVWNSDATQCFAHDAFPKINEKI